MAIQGFDTNYFIDSLFAYAKGQYSEWATGKTTDDLKTLLQNFYPDAETVDDAAEQFYTEYGVAWGLAPNAYFSAAEYRLAYAEKQVAENKAFTVTAALAAYDAELADEEGEYHGNAYAHYLAVGAAMGVNPSNAFDESDYLQSIVTGAKLDMTVDELREAAIDAGLTPVDFYVDYPEYQTKYPAIAVKGDELVNVTPASTNFTLTSGVDKATANIFDAPRVWNPDESAQMNSLNDDDVLTGTGTNPTLNFTYVQDTETGDADIMPTLTGIETINIAFTDNAGQTLDLQDSTGVKAINASRIDNNIITNIVNIQEALTDLSISDSNSPTSTVNITFVDKALRGTSDSLNLELDNAQLAQLLIEEVAVADQGYETINLNSTGSANSVAVMTAEDIKSLIITGDENLTIGSLDEAGSLTTVDASALGSAEGSTAALDYTVNAVGLPAGSAGSIMAASPDGTSNGNVAFSLTATKNNDTVRIFDQVGTNDTLAAGDGTDTIIMANVATTTFFANGTAQATGFEAARIVRAEDGNAVVNNAILSVDLDQMSGDQTILLLNQENEGATTTYNLDNATAAEATGITIMHSGTDATVGGDNGVLENVIDLDVTDGVTTAAVAIVNGTNNETKFNFTLTADSDGTNANTTNTVANITITDNDNESNSVDLIEFGSHTGTITVSTGQAGTFMNLDSTGSNSVGNRGFGINQTGANPTVAVGSATAAVVAANPVSPFGLDSAFASKYANTTYADATGAGVGFVYNDIGAVTDVDANGVADVDRLVASTITASGYAGDFIARVGEKNQTITTGTGSDTIIFDAVGGTDSSRLTAGLNISDKVAMGTGYDTIIIDGNVAATETIGLADTEWTNLTGVDAIRLGNAGAGAYRLTLSNSLVDQTDAGDRITIINSDGILASAAGSNATINMRSLNNSNFVDFFGANGSGVVESVNTIQVNEVTMSGNSALNGGDNNVVQSYTSAAMNTRFAILTATSLDADLAWAVASGQTTAAAAAAAAAAANLVTPGSYALTAANFAALLPDANNNVLEIYNSAEITVGDLAKVSNFDTIEAINDLGVEQTINITLTDEIVDALVDASHASSTTQAEILSFGAYDNLTNAGAFQRVNLQAATLTAKSGVEVLLGRGVDVVQTGAGNDVVVIAGNYIKGAYGVDAATGFDMNAVANWDNDNDDDNDGIVDMLVGPNGILGDADDVVNDASMTRLAVTDTIALSTGTDTLITYGAVDLTGATITGVETLIVNSDLRIYDTQLSTFTNVKFQGTSAHTLTIVDNPTVAGTSATALSHLTLEGTGNLAITADAGTTSGSVDNITKATGAGTVTAPGITTAIDDALTAAGTGAMTITFAQLTGNDTIVTGGTATITGATNATGGAINAISNDAKTITFTPSAVGTAGFDYTLSDGKGGSDTGHATITVTSTDTTAPGLATTGFFSPADEATSVAIDSNVVITFNETVALGTGTIGLYDVTTDTLVPAATTVTGTTLTINPTGNLANNTAYYVNIAAGAVKDTAGLSYTGITGETTYNFTTIASGGTPSSTVAVSATGTSDASTGNITYTIGTGTYTYTIDKFAAGDKLDVATGAVVNVVPDSNQADGSQTITVSDSATGTTATIILTGITSAQDAGLFNAASIDTVFGAGTVI